MLGEPSSLILRILGALAPPLILVAVLDTLVKARLGGGVARRMIGLLLLNTVVAICLGLLVANVVRPGQWSKLDLKSASAPHSGAATPQTRPTRF